METTNKRGGKRAGAGRKKTSVKTYTVYATQQIVDILEAVEGSKSDFVCQCILKATGNAT